MAGAKVLLTLPPVLAMTILFSAVVALAAGSSTGPFLELGTLVIWLGCGFVSIGVAAGGIDPHFDALDDRRAVGLVGTLAGLGGSLGFGILSVGSFALFVFGAGAAAGTADLGRIPATPVIGGLMWAAGLVLAAGALAVVALLMWLANSRLQGYETAIANT